MPQRPIVKGKSEEFVSTVWPIENSKAFRSKFLFSRIVFLCYVCMYDTICTMLTFLKKNFFIEITVFCIQLTT